MRRETVYPLIKAGLASCTEGGAAEKWDAIQARIDTLEFGMMEKVWGENGISVSTQFSISQHEWDWHLYYSAGKHFGYIDELMYVNASVSEFADKEVSEDLAFLS